MNIIHNLYILFGNNKLLDDNELNELQQNPPPPKKRCKIQFFKFILIFIYIIMIIKL